MASSGFKEIDWYEVPLYYDIVFEEDTGKEGAFLEDVLKLHGDTRGKRVLEPACGSGRLVAEMASRGFTVVGFDQSDEMLEFAKERLLNRRLKASLNHAKMESFELGTKFDLAHCLVSTFKYLLDEGKARNHLRCVASALKPGGVYVLGFHLSDYSTSSRSRERWVGRRGEVSVVCNIQSWPPIKSERTEKVRSRMVVEERGETRRIETSWDFRTYDAAQVRRLFCSAPDLEHVATYDFGYDLNEPRELDDHQLDCVFILKKR